MQNWLITSFVFFLGAIDTHCHHILQRNFVMKKQAFKLSTLLKSFHPICHIFTFLCALQFGIDVKLGLELKNGIDVNSFTSS